MEIGKQITLEDVCNHAINVFIVDCLKTARKNWSSTHVEMLETLFACVKEGCEYKCVNCSYFGRPSDAPETVERDCIWQQSEEDGWNLPCEDDE